MQQNEHFFDMEDSGDRFGMYCVCIFLTAFSLCPPCILFGFTGLVPVSIIVCIGLFAGNRIVTALRRSQAKEVQQVS